MTAGVLPKQVCEEMPIAGWANGASTAAEAAEAAGAGLAASASYPDSLDSRVEYSVGTALADERAAAPATWAAAPAAAAPAAAPQSTGWADPPPQSTWAAEPPSAKALGKRKWVSPYDNL